LAEDSKGKKVEEIPEIVSPQLIRPEKERGGRIERKQRRRLGGGALGFRPEEDDGPDKRDPPVSDRARARARADGCGLGRGEREQRFWADFRPKAKRRLLKPFSI
jgi:hypothetical protein